MLEIFAEPSTWVSLLTLSAMEIVLGIDNIVFLTILVGKLPPAQQPRARRLGLGLALGTRLALLFAISWLMGLDQDLFEVLGQGFSGRDLILLGGGLFLVGKATFEIHDKLEVQHEAEAAPQAKGGAFGLVLVQIALLDLVFSLDSVITAVGMVPHLSVMVVAMVIAVGVMLVFAAPIGGFVERHPSLKILALSFLILIGVMLVADAMGRHIPKGYIYFAMAFSLGVEMLNMRLRKAAPVQLHHRFEREAREPQPPPAPPPARA
jgi:predicted tellurium resistance membrane protein TerC